jgi:HD-GYP domain-containing protein (c-di-GMP phosphodiesterase class II)
MQYNLNIREVTYALSGALDFVGIDDTLHGKRVAYMASQMAKELGWDDKLINDVIFIGMLHDCGVSSTDVHTHLVTELDWNNSHIHSRRGENLLMHTKIYSSYALYVRYHHTHWDMLPEHLSEREKLITNLIYLVDRVDALNAQMQHTGVRSIYTVQDTIKKFSQTMFSPELVEIFLTISSRESFWFYLENDALSEYFNEWIKEGEDEEFTFEDVREIALMFAAVVDAKSEFTSVHSLGVSIVSRHLAEDFGLSQESCEKVELAALLHDLGKLKVNDAILEKPTRLNADERLVMNRHGFDSYIILRYIRGFKDIATLASLHHETLDGKGYPYSLNKTDIPIEARIIAVADIFQVLIQDRPYRNGLEMEEAFSIIEDMSKNGKLDADVVQKLKERLEEYCKYATVPSFFNSIS